MTKTRADLLALQLPPGERPRLTWDKVPFGDRGYMARGPARHVFLVQVVHARTFWQAMHINNGHLVRSSDLFEGPEGLKRCQRWCQVIYQQLRAPAVPCKECPWRVESLPGWLGPLQAREWIGLAQSDQLVLCHTRAAMQCAGAAIFRANICKLPRDPEALRLPADRTVVFALPAQFIEHHSILEKKKKARKK